MNDAACPGALHAVVAVDGLLARVRVPGGYIATDAFEALGDLAETYGDGNLDITSRANVQIRGLSGASLRAFGAGLARAGLLPYEAHERVRNVVASPFAGYDASELVDVRATVRAFDDGLGRDAQLAALPAKFMVAIDGGGVHAAGARADLALRAVGTRDDARFALEVGGDDAGVTVPIAEGAALLLASARTALAVARATTGDDRTWRIAAGRRSGERSTIAAPRSPRGVIPAQDDVHANVVPSVPLGRMTATQARCVAALARQTDCEIRLGAWRGIALVGVKRTSLDDVTTTLDRIGLPLNNIAGFDGLAACAGTSGCGASQADVRADAVALAARVRAWQPGFAFALHVAGCEKRCAMRGGADLDLVARPGGYDLLERGVVVRAAVTPAIALELADEIRRDAIRRAEAHA